MRSGYCEVQASCPLQRTSASAPAQNVVRQNCAMAQTKLPSYDEARAEFARSYLSQILQITGGNVSQAARLARHAGALACARCGCWRSRRRAEQHKYQSSCESSSDTEPWCAQHVP